MRISIAGTGKIVGEVLPMLRREMAGKVEVTGIYAREGSVDRALALCQEYAPTGYVYTDYPRMLEEAEADYVYIANANHVHFDYAMAALRAGRGVIVEKPVAQSRAETDQMLDLAAQKCLRCLPAYSLLYSPLLPLLAQALPRLGTVRLIRCDYSQRSSRYDRYLRGDAAPVFDPAMGGGSLRDLNVYNLCFLISLLGPPRRLRYCANKGFNGADTSGVLLCQYPDCVAALSAAKDSDGRSGALIQGELGHISVEGPVSELRSFTLSLRGQEPVTRRAPEGWHRLRAEFEEFRLLAEDPAACHINIPFVSRVAQETAIALERMEE